ncbi:MAG TPA: DUF3352 domain-containing protein [Bacteroidia bacterium]|jgi:hypothetical protein|nr:DUF3352 domain-containing protein [Bacteroidia bacterium]
MIKKIIAIVVVVILLGGGTYMYFHLKKTEIPVNSAIKAIPIDASFLFESRKTLPLWKNISVTSDIWKDLLEIPYFSELNGQLKSLDSIVRENPEIGSILESQSLFISAHINGMNRFNYLFVCSLPAGTSQTTLNSYLDSLKGNSPANDLHYEETTIHCLKIDETNSLYYTNSNGIFIASYAPALIKESLRQLESGISLMDNAYFTKVLNASGGQPAANLFINFQTFANVASHLANRNFLPILSSVQDFGQWMELDITVNPDELIMTGFTDCDSTGNQFLNLFQKQSSREIKAASVAPANTTYMLCHEFSDYAAFHKDYIQYLGRHNRSRTRTEWINRLQQNYNLNIEKYFYPWINTEVAEIITEPSDSSLQNDTYVLMEATDVKEAMTKLTLLADTLSARKKMKTADSNYMHHEIHNLNLDNVMGYILGSGFDGVTKSWFTSVGNYIVFGNSLKALKIFIYSYEGSNTLDKDNYYKDYVKQHVESESGIYVYNNMALSPLVYANYLDKSFTVDMKKHMNVFSKFHAASLQFSYLQGMFYTNLYLKRNPMFRKEIVPLWQVALDTTLQTPPCWVTEHITHGQYVLVEDKNETVYLISNNGHIEWKKQIEGDIQSPVFQVDALKNNKIQYLFNTAGNIILLDRKGNEFEGYPLKLKYSASGPINVFDYDNNRNYRLMLAGDDSKIHEYDINGKPVEGWAMPETRYQVKCAAHYLQLDNKDYIFFIDDGGKVYALDRKGNEKLNLDNRMPQHIRNFYVQEGKSLSDSYILASDSTGTVFKLSLTGELSTIQYLKGSYNNPDFVPGPTDSMGKQEMIFLSGTDLWAYNKDKTEQFHISAKDELENNLSLFVYPDRSLRIGAVDQKNDRIYLWNNSGNICPGFPIYGSGSFSIADMKNDGSLYLVTGADNKIYVYSLQ